MAKHVLLSPSSSHRWLNCPPSARLGENYADTSSDNAREGTCAHALCEFKLRQMLGQPAEHPSETIDYFGDFYDAEMEHCADEYVAFIQERIEENKPGHTLVMVEQRLDMSDYVPDGMGTGDCVLLSGNVLHVIDYKYGTGVLVEAEGNPQMRLYALGALTLLGDLYDIDYIDMTIFQPRRANLSTTTMSKTELCEWANSTLKPTAELAYAGEGEFKCGDWCRFCKAKVECRG